MHGHPLIFNIGRFSRGRGASDVNIEIGGEGEEVKSTHAQGMYIYIYVNIYTHIHTYSTFARRTIYKP